MPAAKLVVYMSAFLIQMFFGIAQAAESSPALLQVKPVVLVSGSNASVSFGEIINTHGLTADDLEIFSKLAFIDAPKPGEVRSFANRQVEEMLLPAVKELGERKGQKIELRIPARVTISRRAMALTNEGIEVELQQRLKALCAECKFEITNLKLPIVNDPLALGWELKMRGEIPHGGFSIPLIVKFEKSERTYWVNGQLNVKKMVPVLARAVDIGEKLRVEDFVLEFKDVTFATDQGATPAEIAASVTAKQAAAGQILWRNGLKREVAVKLGENVRVVSGGESEDAVWQISIDGIAQSSGYIGDMVKVKIPKTQKLVSGLLKEKGLVEVR